MTFDAAAHSIARIAGAPVTTLLAVVFIILWGFTGPIYHFSDTWQLVVQSVATVITLPLLFINQCSHLREAAAQNEEIAAMHAKLDAILEKL